MLGIKELEEFKFAITNGAAYRLYMDGLPSATRYTRKSAESDEETLVYSEGIPVGHFLFKGWSASPKKEETVLYNHWNIVIRYQFVEGSNKVRIVGFEVEPLSHANYHATNFDEKTF